MILLSLLASQAVHAAECSVDRILQNPKSPCTQEYIKKISDEQDRAEFKFRLSRWKQPAQFKVYSDHGFIEAQMDGKTIARAVWLKYSSPAILWLNGKILTDRSNNPSMARTLDKMFRGTKTASLLLPEAYAQEDQDLVKNVVFFYSVDDVMTNSKTVEGVASSKVALTRFMPASNPILNFFGGPTVNCASANTIEAKLVEMNPGQSEMQVLVTPKSPTEFKLTGIEKGRTHLVTLTSFTLKLGNQVKTILHPKFSLEGAMIAECVDPDCRTTTKEMPYQDRELIYGRSPEKEKQAEASRSKTEKEEAQRINQDRRDLLGTKMFGMSVMGNCCDNTVCRGELKNNYNVNLVPASTSGTTTH